MANPKYPSGTGATASVSGHPLHPLLVPIPVAALAGGGEMTFRHGIGVSRGVGGHRENENPDLTPSGRLDVGKS